eukprot:SAG22_NODE_14842_length_363_cov_1.174242_1_plen_34_part_10
MYGLVQAPNTGQFGPPLLYTCGGGRKMSKQADMC